MELGEYRPMGDDGPRRLAERRGPSFLWIGVAGAVLLGAGAYWMFGRDEAAPAANLTPPAATEARIDPAPAAPSVSVELPPLDASDAFVRDLLKAVSARPELAAWLATDGLIRNFVLVVDNVSQGRTPARHLRVLAPRGPFRVATVAGHEVAAPASFARYDGLAQAAVSLDVAGLARAYVMLKPRFEEAYGELGRPLGSFDTATERAIVHLLETPIPPADAWLRRQGATGYRYDNPRFEALSGAQKQLLRMGPDNARLVQQTLRRIAEALRVPASRLPR
ncbi:MAG: DUF3014 domain-containing protein [Acidobacteriota bacterium]